MVTTYASEPSKVRPAKLTQAELAYVGRIVRGGAEIEDMINLFLSRLSKLSEGRIAVLLGRTQLTRRLEIARYFAKLDRSIADDLYQTHFGTKDFEQFVECRNALSHGVFMGKSDKGRLLFLTTKTLSPDNGLIAQVVCGYRRED